MKKRGRTTNINAEKILSEQRKTESPVSLINNAVTDNIIQIKLKETDPKYLKWKKDNDLKLPSEKETSQKQEIDKEKDIKQEPIPKESIIKRTYENAIIMPDKNTDGLKLITQQFNTIKTTEILDKFYKDRWPIGLEKRCCYCTLKFTHQPTVLPYNIQKKNKRIQGVKNMIVSDTFICEENPYCSFNCVLAELDRRPNLNKYLIKQMLYDLYRVVSGRPISIEIIQSPPKEIMIDYGGILTEAEYKKLIGDTAIYMLDYPHIICVGSRISRVRIFNRNKITGVDTK